MDFLTILPMAIVMVAGPQILSPIFLATSKDYRRNSLAYLAGAALAITLGVTIVYVVANLLNVSGGKSQQSSGMTAVDWVLVGLLLYLMLHLYLTRKRHATPPAWMGKLQSASPGFAGKLGFLLFVLMPTDIITMIAVGTTLARDNSPWWKAVPFLCLTLLLAALPLLTVLVLGRRAQVFLPKLRDWMNANSWLVNEFVVLFFLIVTVV